jgi:signal transduction histidine kinase
MEATAALLGELVGRRQAASEHERDRDLLLGMLAHDLRNPLTSIVLGARALAASRDSARGAQLGERIARSAERMNRLIEDLVETTRSMIGGGITLELTPCALDQLCAEVVDEVRTANPGHELAWSASGDVTATCDTTRIHEVVTNLLVNAVRHGGPGVVELTLTGAADEITIAIHNGGTPIPTEALPTLFDAFSQVKRARGAERSRGLGLGLYIAREIVRAHGGAIAVESSDPEGTTFTTHLPRR